jgi:lysophospholipase L1-like esterase
MTRRFERYVAIGDSTTEGLDDPDGRGGYRGWANRLAEQVTAAQGSLLYANLAVRGRLARQIREEQLERALEMRPDLATVVAGMNDLVRPRFDAEAVGDEVGRMQSTLVQGGATVLTFTLPDLGKVIPLARRLAPRTVALNEALRSASSRSGAILVDLAAHSFASDPRLWSHDRFHANALGHERIAAALAHAIELPGTNGHWSEPLPPAPAPSGVQRLAGELRWWGGYLLPWIWRHVRGRSSGDGRVAKRPALSPVEELGALILPSP